MKGSKANPGLSVEIAVTEHPDAAARLRRAFELVLAAAERAERRAETQPRMDNPRKADDGHGDEDDYADG